MAHETPWLKVAGTDNTVVEVDGHAWAPSFYLTSHCLFLDGGRRPSPPPRPTSILKSCPTSATDVNSQLFFPPAYLVFPSQTRVHHVPRSFSHTFLFDNHPHRTTRAWYSIHRPWLKDNHRLLRTIITPRNSVYLACLSTACCRHASCQNVCSTRQPSQLCE
ncbi:hypothetical protein BDY19DRAFT_337251 [Irpex rosettiformis]|uniref:Uncharacterized protein n=1 Tax=Irpex rosettiformis TaxID=378272 RepID=A0ACB8TXF4_9APHY|nr:hypothetical protein BDY19DRAFT_337251 [Irpex rosettiformis]